MSPNQTGRLLLGDCDREPGGRLGAIAPSPLGSPSPGGADDCSHGFRSSRTAQRTPSDACGGPGIFKTLHLLQFISDVGYRRMIGIQLNVQEARHRLARRIAFGNRASSAATATAWGTSSARPASR